MEEVLKDRNDMLEAIEKEVRACAKEDNVKEFGNVYAK